MDKSTAQRIGAKKAVIHSLVGLSLAYLFFSFITFLNASFWESFLWIFDFDYVLNVLLGALFIIVFAFQLGRLAGYFILIRKYNWFIIGLLCTVTTTVLGVFMGTLPSFFIEGLGHGLSDGISSYIITPILAVLFFGFLPILALGISLGIKINRKRLD